MKTINKIIVGFMITGFVVITVGFSLGGYDQMVDIFQKDGNYWGWRAHEITDIDKEFSDIQNIDLEIDASNVSIEEYAGTSVRVEARNVSKRIVVSDKNGTLVINDENSVWGLGIGFFNSNGKITIYIPQGKEFNNVEMDVDAGSVDVDTLKANYLDIQVNAGRLNGNNVTCNRGEFEVDAGKIVFDTLDGQDLKFNVDAGIIEASLVGSEQEYRYQSKCEVGSVNIGSYKASGIDASDSGGNGTRYIEAECDIGKIDIRMEG